MTMPGLPSDFSPSALLQYAVGAPALIRLEEITSEGDTIVHEVPTPYGLIGRGTECDIRIPANTVSFRHVYLQPIGPRLAFLDLFTATGIEWLEGPEFKGWLSPEHLFRLGDSFFRLADDVWIADEHLKAPVEFRPREEQLLEYGPLATVELELLNTSAKGKRWPINRIITLVGRDDRCRITVADDRVSRVHCSLLLLPSGLWAIDLLGKGGIQVNGSESRCGLLSEGTELSIGPYRLSAHYTQAAPSYTPYDPQGFYTEHGTVGEGTPPTVETGQSDHSAAPVPVVSRIQGEQQFVTRQNRLFIVEGFEDTMIVRPKGDGRGFFYQEVHRESSRVSDIITSRKYNHLVVDLSECEVMGKIVLDALTQMCRNTLGKVAFCNATPETYSELERSGLARVWDHYLSLDDAYLAVHVNGQASSGQSHSG